MPITAVKETESRWPPDLSNLPSITTERLELRFLVPGDAAAACAIARDWEVARWTARIPHPYELHMAEEWIADGAKRRLAGEELGMAIVRREDTLLIGGVSLTFDRGPGAAEIGYFLGRAYWGQGYMREAVAGFLTAAFEKLGVETVWAETVLDNSRSSALQEALGFTFMETKETDAPARGGSVSVEVRRLSRSDWQRRADG